MRNFSKLIRMNSPLEEVYTTSCRNSRETSELCAELDLYLITKQRTDQRNLSV